MKAGQCFYHEPQNQHILPPSKMKGHSRVCGITLPFSSIFHYLFALGIFKKEFQ